jgi:hypothetical protein
MLLIWRKGGEIDFVQGRFGQCNESAFFDYHRQGYFATETFIQSLDEKSCCMWPTSQRRNTNQFEHFTEYVVVCNQCRT